MLINWCVWAVLLRCTFRFITLGYLGCNPNRVLGGKGIVMKDFLNICILAMVGVVFAVFFIALGNYIAKALI